MSEIHFLELVIVAAAVAFGMHRINRNQNDQQRKTIEQQQETIQSLHSRVLLPLETAAADIHGMYAEHQTSPPPRGEFDPKALEDIPEDIREQI